MPPVFFKVLRDRLSTVRQVSKDAAYAELQGRLHSLAEQLRLANEEEAKSRQQVQDMKCSGYWYMRYSMICYMRSYSHGLLITEWLHFS